jgi:asparagine N-glycosylation enzyme membrane subunit Stt3
VHFRKPWATLELVETLSITDRAWDDAMRWMKTKTPPPFGPDDRVNPVYGVASYWESGNLISFLGERPAVWSRYPTREDARWLTATEEMGLVHLYLGKCPGPERIRYAVLNPRAVTSQFLTAVLFAGGSLAPYLETGDSIRYQGRELSPASYGIPYRQAVSVRMYYQDGSGLEHHRLVYETRQQSRHAYRFFQGQVLRIAEIVDDAVVGERVARDPDSIRETPDGALEYDESIHASIKIFEIVRGAFCEGRALPGTEVVATLSLEVEETGRRFRYENRTSVTEDGSYRLTLPYPTLDRPESSVVRALGPYQVDVVGLGGVRLETGVASVGELEVRQGSRVTPRMKPVP